VDPVRSVLSWRPYATFHQDHQAPAARARAELAPGDRIVVCGPSYWASIYAYYLDAPIDYIVTEKTDRLYKNGYMVHHVTGARCLITPSEVDSTLAAEAGHRVWIFADLNLLTDSNHHFSPAMKATLSPLLLPPYFVGRDHDTVLSRREPSMAGVLR
jgi:hypothetical protein